MISPKQWSFYLYIIIPIGLVDVDIHNRYSDSGLSNQKYQLLHVSHPQLSKTLGFLSLKVSQSTNTDNDVPATPGKITTGAHGPAINSSTY